MTRTEPTMTSDAAQRTQLVGAVERELRSAVGELSTPLAPVDVFFAVSRATRGTILERMHATEQRFRAAGAKRVHYLSAEFLIGRSLENNLVNLGLLDPVRDALDELGADLETAFKSERDAALGSGGLGRLAACFVDSLASLDMPGYGYGLNYEHGLFRQEIRAGEQVEHPDSWRIDGSPWLIDRRTKVRDVPLYGRVDARLEPDAPGGWSEFKIIQGVPSDLPVVGWGGRTVTFLRLYRARAVDGFDLGTFQEGRGPGAARVPRPGCGRRCRRGAPARGSATSPRTSGCGW
jgi:starch phosphorylase